MSDFINTIDQLGDKAVQDSIIDKSIIEFKDNVLKTIGEYAFYNCTSLTTVDLPNVTLTGDQSFYNCNSLTTVNLPSVTKVKYRTFMYNGKLTTVNLPSLTSIDVDVFYSCNSLKTLILRNTNMATLARQGAFSETPIEWGNGYIYVPRALLDDTDSTKDYRQATNWSNFSTQFRALEDWTVDGTIYGELDWDKINAAA